jgi:hypothetical protein
VERIKCFKDFIKKFKILEPLSNVQIENICKELNIRNFKGVFMRNELNIKRKATSNECLILNLDHSENSGTHWVCLFIKNDVSFYFDSYGFPPPLEVCEYYQHKNRYYNTFKIQKEDEVICGHYCIYMLFRFHNESTFDEVLDELYRYNH